MLNPYPMPELLNAVHFRQKAVSSVISATRSLFSFKNKILARFGQQWKWLAVTRYSAGYSSQGPDEHKNVKCTYMQQFSVFKWISNFRYFLGRTAHLQSSAWEELLGIIVC
ncbi:hypothetical protein ANCCAN_10208 [Ancylostoma caninum]|uniref:Uncharacterized protein n=1 Tax=Ancylostoma caninum TaxID=29170 RepID=A0A368GKN5_ANCCA|nr:hypothetical protein ANCCAN_10208 [Ancylostoma caninum]